MTSTARPAGRLLEVREVAVRFGGIVALGGVSFVQERGEILGLIGPNGAGKTTLFNCLSRLYTPSSGEILFEGRSILREPPHRMAGIGMGRTFQNIALFKPLSVRQNIMIGGHARSRGDLVRDVLRWPSARRTEEGLGQRTSELIRDLELGDVADRPVDGLPFGTQKRVELARALAADPSLLLLDEPACGLNHEEIGELARLIRQIRDERQVTILLVEHHMSLVMSISEKVVALNFGRVIAEGSPAAVQRDPEVIRAYLGTERH